MLQVDPDSTSALWLKTGPYLACGRMEGGMLTGAWEGAGSLAEGPEACRPSGLTSYSWLSKIVWECGD